MGKPAKRSATPPKNGTFMGIKDVQLFSVAYEFSQDSDSCQPQDNGQNLKVFTGDGGGGSYVIIETARWAIDDDDIDKFADCLKRIVSIPEV